MTSRSIAPGGVSASCRQERFVSLQRFVVQSILLTALNYTYLRRRVGESPARLASAAATASAVPCRLVVWNDGEATDAWSLAASVMHTGCVSGEVERRTCVEGHMIALVHATTVPSGHASTGSTPTVRLPLAYCCSDSEARLPVRYDRCCSLGGCRVGEQSEVRQWTCNLVHAVCIAHVAHTTVLQIAWGRYRTIRGPQHVARIR